MPFFFFFLIKMTNLIMTFENKLTMLPTFLKISMNPQLVFLKKKINLCQNNSLLSSKEFGC